MPGQRLPMRKIRDVLRLNAEVFHRGKRVATHVRSPANRKHTTVREHMPPSHQRHADWTPERIQRQANEIGPKTAVLIELIQREKTHPEQGVRACIGIEAARQDVRLRTARSRLRPGAGDRRTVLHVRHLDPQDQPRSQTARTRHGRAGDRA